MNQLRLSGEFPPIRYFGHFAPGSGYNTAARGLLQVFKALGLGPGRVRCVPISTVDRTPDATVDDWTLPYLYPPVELDAQGNPKKTRFSLDEEPINLVHGHPLDLGRFWTGGRYNIAYTVWETDKLPVAPIKDELTQKDYTVVEAMNRFDEVWVACRWNKEMLERCGVTVPVFVVPHALLPEVLAEEPRPAGGDDSVDFYFMGPWSIRKDPALLLSLYWSCGFTITSGVDLQLYCTPPTTDKFQIQAHAWRSDTEYRRLQEALPDKLGAASCSGPQTLMVPYKKVVQRHLDGDVFVSASHGEGFCIPILEALALGRWVIAGGPWVQEFAEQEGPTLGLLDAVEVIPTTVGPIIPTPEVKGHELGQKWWNVDHDAFREALVNARSELSQGQASLESARIIRDRYAPARIAEAVRPMLERAADVASRTGW